MEFKTFLRALVAQCLLAGLASATQWTVTSYYAESVVTSQYGTYTDDVYTYTTTISIKPTASITAAPTSTYTSTDTYYDLKVVEIYYDPDDVEANDIVPTTSYDPDDYSGSYTYWVQEIVYTAPTSCPTAFTVTTYTNVYVPSAVEDQLSPTSTTKYVSTYRDGDKYTYVTAYLSQGAVPTTTATTSDFVETYYIDNCRNPTATGDAYWGPDSSSGGSSDDDDDDSDSYYSYCYGLYGCTSVKTWVIIVASVIPSLFLFGFFESFFWFRRLMLGKAALRFGTICWCLISLWVICFTRHTGARNKADHPGLRQQWNALPMGTRFKLWFKWGFRHAYPVDLLGPDPRGVTPSTAATPIAVPFVPKPADGQPPMAGVQPPYGQPVYASQQPVFGQQPFYEGQQPVQGPYGQPVYLMPQPYMQPQYNMAPPGTTPSPMDTATPTPPPAVHMQNQDRTISPPSEGLQVTPPPEQQQQQPPQNPPEQPLQHPPQQPPHPPQQ